MFGASTMEGHAVLNVRVGHVAQVQHAAGEQEPWGVAWGGPRGQVVALLRG
jgi:hypothetical protein